MLTSSLITLLTDFGLQDVYVGVMKGVIAQINPNLTTVDLTHQIAPQDVLAARFNLMNAYSYFPQGTVHTVVVDPGVGSQRRGIAVAIKEGYLVAPDNGVLSGVWQFSPAQQVVELTNPHYWRTSTPSATFHGRDIFAPVAAHLSSGVPLTDLGREVDPNSLKELPIEAVRITPEGIQGCIQYIDHFGNLITNIPANIANLAETNWFLKTATVRIPKSVTYNDRALGEISAIIGSHGWLEIAVNQGSAAQQLQMQVTDAVICQNL